MIHCRCGGKTSLEGENSSSICYVTFLVYFLTTVRPKSSLAGENSGSTCCATFLVCVRTCSQWGRRQDGRLWTVRSLVRSPPSFPQRKKREYLLSCSKSCKTHPLKTTMRAIYTIIAKSLQYRNVGGKTGHWRGNLVGVPDINLGNMPGSVGKNVVEIEFRRQKLG